MPDTTANRKAHHFSIRMSIPFSTGATAMGPQFRQKTGIQCHEAHEGIDTISMYLTSISFKNALLFHRRYEKLKAENSPTHFQIMPTPKQTTSKSTSTKKRDVLGPIQAKRFASQYPLLDNPANLPIDQVQSLLITALRGDIQQLKHQVKALEEIGANVFALTWNVNHLHKSSRFKDDVFMAKADICEVVMLVEVTDSVIYFAKKAKSEAPQIFEKVVNSYEFDWTARLQGQAVAHKSWNIWKAITVPQTEAQAFSILQDNVPAYWHSKVQAMWKHRAGAFLAQQCQHTLASAIGPVSVSNETLGSSPPPNVDTGFTPSRL